MNYNNIKPRIIDVKCDEENNPPDSIGINVCFNQSKMVTSNGVIASHGTKIDITF